MVRDFEERYLKGQLRADELPELRRQLASETDEDVARRMDKRWEAADDGDGAMDDGQAERVWASIDEAIRPASRGVARRVWMWVQRVAVVLLPILVGVAAYFHHEKTVLTSGDIVMSTGEGEFASITLPDGTQARLNEKSIVRYNSQTFNREQRDITFNGEATFKVAKDSLHPFRITADRTSVEVLGTEFNLLARDGDSISAVTLLKGRVALSCPQSGQRVTMVAGQKATLDRRSGMISVERYDAEQDRSLSWQRKELVFRNTPLRQVIAQLEQTHHVRIRVAGSIDLNDLFTGTLSTTDINTNLEVLERLYHLRTRMTDGVVTISRQR